LVVQLSDSDLQGLLRFLYEAGEVDGPEPFPDPVVRALYELIPADLGVSCVEFRECDPTTRPEALTVLSFAEVECEWCMGISAPWTEELDETAQQYVERDEPIRPRPDVMNRPVRYSDFLSAREYHSLGLYADVHRLLGVEDSLHLWLSVPGEDVLRRLGFASSRRKGVTRRDIRVLELLTPFLRQFYRRAAARRATASRADGLTAREREILALVAEGKTNAEVARLLWISPHTVRTHLENTFDKLGVKTRAAAVAQVYASAADLGNGTPPANGGPPA
jgi:DNA-binding CsgD family transcriptional regulator